MASYAPAQVAELLGVNADTVRRWCDDGKLPSSRNDDGHRTIDGADLARYLVDHDDAYEPRSLFRQSARNRFTGIVTRIEADGVAAVVEIHAPPHRIVSLMTREAIEEMELQVGDLATAAVKATTVIVEVPS